jgi:DNA-binding beta-propeller fold protein YncE
MDTVTPTKDPAGTDQGGPATTHDKPVVSIAASGSTTITFAGTTKIAAKDAVPDDEPNLDPKSKPEADPKPMIQSVVTTAAPAPAPMVAKPTPAELAVEEKPNELVQALDAAPAALAPETAPTATVAMASVSSITPMAAAAANPGPLTIAADISVGKGSGPSALSPDGNYLYVVNTSDNTVSVVNTRTNTAVSVPIPQYAMATVIGGDAGRYVYVSHQTGTSVTVIDTRNNNAVSELDMGERAPRLWVSPDGKLVYVGVQTGIAVIDTATNTRTSTHFTVDSGAWDVAFNANGSRLYVVSRTGGTSSAPNRPPNGSVAEFDTYTGNQVGDSISVGFSPVSLAVTPNGRYVYVANNLPADYVLTGLNEPRPPGTVSVIDLQAPTPSVVATIPVGYGPVNLVVSPDGHRVYVVNSFNTGDLSAGLPSGGTVSVIDADHNTVVGEPLPTGLPMFGIFSGGLKGIVVSSDSRRLYVFNVIDNPRAPLTEGTPTSSLLAFDTSSTGTPTLLGSIPVGYQPSSLILSPNGTRVYVTSLMPRNFDFASFPTDGSLPNGAVTVVNTAASSPLPPPPPVRKPLPVKKKSNSSPPASTPVKQPTTPLAKTKVQPTKPHPTNQPTKNSESFADQILKWAKDHPVPTEASLAKDLTEFLAKYVNDYAKMLQQLHVKQLFDSLPSWMKNDAFDKIAQIADGKIKFTPSMIDGVAGVAKFALRWMAPLSLFDAANEASNAHTESEKTHAAVSTIAAWAPFFGAAVGFVIAGPPGGIAGWSAGGAAGLGLSIGNNVTKAFGW